MSLGGIDPTGKLKLWLWDVSEMTCSAFPMFHFFAVDEGCEPALTGLESRSLIRLSSRQFVVSAG